MGMEREGSLHGLEAFDKLTLEKARTASVEELDDEGWRIASIEKRVIELGGLGEGAGGAVTRCMLKGCKTVFALKVWNWSIMLSFCFSISLSQAVGLHTLKGYHNEPDPDVKKQIVREIGFNKECASEHICRYFGAFVDPATATISIAMEFCEGGLPR